MQKCWRGKPVWLSQRQNSFQHAGDILLGDHTQNCEAFRINNEDELNNVNNKIK